MSETDFISNYIHFKDLTILMIWFGKFYRIICMCNIRICPEENQSEAEGLESCKQKLLLVASFYMQFLATSDNFKIWIPVNTTKTCNLHAVNNKLFWMRLIDLNWTFLIGLKLEASFSLRLDFSQLVCYWLDQSVAITSSRLVTGHLKSVTGKHKPIQIQTKLGLPALL